MEDAGGTVEYGYVNGELAVSRSIGDISPNTGEKYQGVTAEPTVHSRFIQEDDEFIIVACDGLWDAMTSEWAVTFAR